MSKGIPKNTIQNPHGEAPFTPPPRKQILQYDDVMREQREIIYKQRDEVLESENLRKIVEGMMKSVVETNVKLHTPDSEVPEDWDLQAIANYINNQLLSEDDLTEKELKGLDPEEIIQKLAN